MKNTLTSLLIILLSVSIAFAQEVPESHRLSELQIELEYLSDVYTAYGSEVDISVGKQPLQELLRNVAKVTGVNLNVRGADSIEATCNFSRVKVTDLLYFLCKEYDLDLDIVGNIVAISPVVRLPDPPKEINVSYAIATGRLSLDLSDDPLADVTKKLTDLTGANFLIPQTLSQHRLSGYVKDMQFGEAIRSIATMNGLEAINDADNIWAFYSTEQSTINLTSSYKRHTPFSPAELSIDSLGLITAQIGRGDVQDIITDLCEQQRLNYFFATPVSGQTSVWVREVDFETLLDVMLLGTEISYYRENGIYIFGTRSTEKKLTTVEVVKMKYRSVNKLSEIIPKSLSDGIQIQEFHDLNSVVLGGERAQISRIETFLRSVDKRVPLVTIEIIIVDATKQRIMQIGIDAGFGKDDVQSSGSLAGVDLMLNATTVSKLINSFNGFGSINLGQVSPSFYLGLQFLEDNGIIEMQSTPKLSTLNGHEATLKSGETRYYKETANNFYGSQIPVSTESFLWKPIDANLEIKITPFVSEDEHITLDISIDQTEFTAREESEAPPGTATRSFKSLIRVQNEEMVLLGGMDQNTREKSNRGLPWMARVPVLRSIFGKSKDNKSEHRLNVFIKPILVE